MDEAKWWEEVGFGVSLQPFHWLRLAAKNLDGEIWIALGPLTLAIMHPLKAQPKPQERDQVR